MPKSTRAKYRRWQVLYPSLLVLIGFFLYIALERSTAPGRDDYWEADVLRGVLILVIVMFVVSMFVANRLRIRDERTMTTDNRRRSAQ